MGYFSKLKESKIIWIFSILYLCGVVEAQFTPEELIVDAGPLGKLRGDQTTSAINKRPFIKFVGIPYGKTPEGSSRFLPAEPAAIPLAPEGEIFNATKTTACCPQPSAYFLCMISQKEDCLGISVYTPTAPSTSTKLLPVIVFIHGGGFTMGSDGIYGGARLLEERDVILVTFNYRLGTLGFFCLNTESAPGNAAMYDMREALIWIKTYIQYFGGDPNSITIAGQSAGSAAVSHLMTSPLTRDAGLFHRAIAMSGTVLNEWGTTTSEKAEKSSLEIAQLVGCYDPATTPYEPETIVSCMQAIPAKDLVSKLDQYQVKENNAGRLGFEPVTPIIQKVGPSGGAKFLDENPEDIIERNEEANVPLITGSTRHDGSFVLATVYNRYLKFNNYLEDQAFLKTRMVPALLNSLGIEDKTEAVFDALANIYLGKEVKDSGNLTVMLPGLTDMFTVFFFKAAVFRTLKLHSRHQPQSYWYNFDYRGRRSVYSTLIPDKTNPVRGGIGHGDDLIYLFSIPLQSLDEEEERAVSKKMVNYWINFAYTGNPNIGESSDEFMLAKRIPQAEQWLVFSEDNPNFAILGAKDEFVAEYPNDYWLGVTHELYPELQEPVLTSTTEETTPLINDGESTTALADEESTTAIADGESTTALANSESTTALADGESSTSTIDSTLSTEQSTEDPPSTTDSSPISQQSSYVLLWIATVTTLIQATR